MIGELFRTVVFWLLGLDRPGTVVEATEWNWYAASPLSMAIVIAFAAVALVLAALNFLPRNGLPWRSRLVVTAIRFCVCALLVCLLCQVELRLTVRRSLRPNVAIVTDTSDSMGLKGKVGRTRLAAARGFDADLVWRLGSRVNISRYRVHWRLDEDDPKAEPAGMTRLMDSLGELARQERDIQAVVVYTDGDDTTGNTGATVAPIFAARGTPIYPVVFGQTEAPAIFETDIFNAPQYVRLGDEYRIDAVLKTRGLEEQSVRASLFRNDSNEPIAVQDRIRLTGKPVRIRFVTKPKKAGQYTYRIVVDGVRGSATTKLLRAEQTVAVIDQRIRVLYVDIPRDERKILGHWLARDQVIDLATMVYLPKEGWYATGMMRHKNVGTGMPDAQEDLLEYDVIIMGDIPRRYFRAGDPDEKKLQWLVEFVTRRGGGLITLGGRSVYGAGQYDGSALAGLLPFGIERTSEEMQITKKFKANPTSIGLGHPIMQLEGDADGTRNAWLDLPKLEGCNRVGPVKPGALELAVRTMSKDEGEGKGESIPVIAYQKVGKGRVLSLSVDTTWRWEMQRPRGDGQDTPEGTDYFRRFWGNAIRFLAPDPRLTPDRPQISRQTSDAAVGETIVLITNLVDKFFNPIRKANVTVKVTAPDRPDGTEGATVRMYPTDNVSRPGVYEYRITLTELGQWRVEVTRDDAKVREAVLKAKKALAAAVKADEDKQLIAKAKRQLAVAEAAIAVETITAGESRQEIRDARARPGAMADFAEATGGAAFGPDQIEGLLEKLNLTTHKVTRSYAIAVWNLPAVLVLFIGLISVDCLIRKRRGLV